MARPTNDAELVKWLQSNISRLLKQIADEGECAGCTAKIWWVVHKNGKKVPYTSEGLNHFADCLKRADFSRTAPQKFV